MISCPSYSPTGKGVKSEVYVIPLDDRSIWGEGGERERGGERKREGERGGRERERREREREREGGRREREERERGKKKK